MWKINITTDDMTIVIDRDYIFSEIESDNEDDDIFLRSPQEVYAYMKKNMYIDEMIEDGVVIIIPFEPALIESERKRWKITITN